MRTFSILPTPRSLSLALALTLGAIILLAACTGSFDIPSDAGSTPSAQGNTYVLPATEDDEKATPSPLRETYIPKADAKAYVGQGLDSWEAGQYERAIEAFDEAIRIDPNYAWAYSNRGIAYVDLGIDRFDTGLFKQAMEDYDEAIRIDPLNAAFYNNRGNLYRRFLQIEKAIADLDEAIRLDPNEAVFYNNRGYIYHHFTLINTDKAIKDYDEAIRINPNEADFYFNRGNAYYRVQQYGRAIANYDEALRLDPNNSHYYDNREATIDQMNGRPHSGLWD